MSRSRQSRKDRFRPNRTGRCRSTRRSPRGNRHRSHLPSILRPHSSRYTLPDCPGSSLLRRTGHCPRIHHNLQGIQRTLLPTRTAHYRTRRTGRNPPGMTHNPHRRGRCRFHLRNTEHSRPRSCRSSPTARRVRRRSRRDSPADRSRRFLPGPGRSC